MLHSVLASQGPSLPLETHDVIKQSYILKFKWINLVVLRGLINLKTVVYFIN